MLSKEHVCELERKIVFEKKRREKERERISVREREREREKERGSSVQEREGV